MERPDHIHQTGTRGQPASQGEKIVLDRKKPELEESKGIMLSANFYFMVLYKLYSSSDDCCMWAIYRVPTVEGIADSAR